MRGARAGERKRPAPARAAKPAKSGGNGQRADYATRWQKGNPGGPGRQPKPQVMRDFDQLCREEADSGRLAERMNAVYPHLRPKDKMAYLMWRVERGKGRARFLLDAEGGGAETLAAMAEVMAFVQLVRTLPPEQVRLLLAARERVLPLPAGGDGAGGGRA